MLDDEARPRITDVSVSGGEGVRFGGGAEKAPGDRQHGDPEEDPQGRGLPRVRLPEAHHGNAAHSPLIVEGERTNPVQPNC